MSHSPTKTVLAASFALAAFTMPRWAMAASTAGNEHVIPVMSQPISTAPGETLSTFLVSYPPGGKSLLHRHAGVVFAYVLTGSIRSENSATGPVRIYKAGDSFFEPAGSTHLICENASATKPASFLAVFVAPTHARLTTLVK